MCAFGGTISVRTHINGTGEPPKNRGADKGSCYIQYIFSMKLPFVLELLTSGKTGFGNLTLLPEI